MCEKLFFRMLRNTLKYYISETKVYLVKFFLLNIHEATDLNVTNILHIFIFFYEICWPRLPSSTKCREA